MLGTTGASINELLSKNHRRISIYGHTSLTDKHILTFISFYADTGCLLDDLISMMADRTDGEKESVCERERKRERERERERRKGNRAVLKAYPS